MLNFEKEWENTTCHWGIIRERNKSDVFTYSTPGYAIGIYLERETIENKPNKRTDQNSMLPVDLPKKKHGYF